ncbi:hypothetical protein KAR91_60195, partial [Candidatus Pacearchaeota archaeon]|nr:hypothetical protein [Candidatus Pacearchaeota archaeon]
ICCLDGAIANLTNENNICESSGSEISCVDATSYDSADYIGWTSDEVNYFVIKLHDSDGTVGQYSDSDGSVLLGDGPEPTGAAIYTFSAVYIVDSAARVDGKQYDSSALRLALGDQFKDVSLTTNDFTNDPNCVALYKFEDTPGFVADSIRDNDLTNNGPEEENTVVFEGAQSAKFIRVNSDQFYISDADLDDDFPMKNGGTGKTYTICGRVYLNSITATHYIMSKYVGAGPFSLSFDSSGYLRLWHQTGGYKPFGTVCQTGRWYSFAVSYNDTDYSYRIRIYDHTANDFLGPDATGDMGGTPTLTTAQLAWGGRADNQDYLDGYLDEIVVFNRWLESYELDTIREKNFSPPLVIDLNYPGNIAGSALASDGAWHTEPDDPTGKPHVDNDDLKEGITEAGQLGEGLVGCWLFNERSGTAINSLTDTDYDGTIVDENSDGYPAWCPEGIKNVSSTSYDRYINIAANPVTPAAFTVITKAIFRNDGHHKLISRHDGTEGFYGWTLTRIGTDDKLRLNFSSDGTAWYQSCETPINACPIDEWATWAATYESGAQKIYKNGNMIESDTQSGAIYNHANQKFMLLYSDYEKENNIEEEAFYGRMEFMFFWNRVLTTDEVMFVTNNPYWVFEQALRMEIAWDRTRHKPNVVVHDLPFVSGTTPDDHLISHLKLDENASSPCLHSQKATNVNDDFTGTNGDAPRSDLWDETDTSNVMDIQNNKLNYAYTGTEQVEGTAYTKYYFEGDFDIQVDFDITTFEASSVNDNRLCLNVRDIDETVWSRIARIVEPDSEQRYEVSGPVTSDTNYLNSATSGKFRVTRVGGTVKGYVWENGRWEWNGSTDGFTFSEDWTDLVVKIALYGLHAASAGSSTMDVNWDNVIINSGASASAFWRELSDGSFRDTNSSGDSVEGVRGNALDTQDTIAYIDASLAGHRNAFFKKGSVFIKFKPVFGFDDGAYQQVWKLWVDDNNLISLWYDYINDRFTARCRIGGANYDVDTPVYTSDNDLQQWHTAHIAWDLDNDFHILILDGKPLGTSIPTNAPPTGDPVIFTFGADDGRGDPAEIYMDEIKTFNDCILPYGSVFVGNGEIDTDLADPDVCFHWDCENSGANASNIPADKTITLNGSAVLATTDPIYGAKHLDTVVDDDDASIPVVSYDILDPRHGSISFWVNLQSAVVNDHILGFGDANNFIALVLDGSGPFRFIYNANSVSIDCTGTVNAIAGKWYHVRLAFSDSNNDGEISLHINGVLLESAAISNAWGYGGTGTLYLGSSYLSWSGQDCFIDQITIAKNPHTPQNWTAFGKPLWRPILQVS